MAADPFAGLSPEERQVLGIDQQGNIKPQQAAPGPAAAPTAATPGAPGAPATAADGDSIGEAITGSTFRGFADVAGGLPARLGITPPAGTGWLANTPAEQAAMAQHPWISGVGRLAGQVVSTLPVILGAEALAPALPFVGAGTVAARLAANPLVRGAAEGAAQNLLTAGEDPNESLVRRSLLGAATGGAAGGLAGKMGQWFGADQALASQAVQDAARTAQGRGIDVTSGNLPRAGATAVAQGALASPEQAQQVTRAFGEVMGENIPDLSHQTLDPLINRLGQDVGNAAGRGQIDGNTILGPLSQIDGNYGHIPRVRNLIDSVMNEVDPATGMIPGPRFQQLIRNGSPLDLATRATNADVSDPASDIERALHDGFMQSSPQGVADAYSLARGKYKLGLALGENARAAGLDTVNPATIYGTLASRRWFPDIARMGAGATTQVGSMTDAMANLARASDKLFGGTGAAASAAPAAPSAIGRGLGIATGLGGAGAAYKAFTDPGSAGAVLTWLAHNPVAAAALLAAGGGKAIKGFGQHYQQTPAFVNRLIQRGTQPAGNALMPWGTLGTAAAPPPYQGP